MASRNWMSNKLYNQHVMPCQLDAQIQIGNTGAVSSFSGPGINAVTRLGPGLYQLQLQDNFNSLLMGEAKLRSPVTGSAIDPNGGTVGAAYQITTVGNTNWTTAGVPAGVTPAVGVVFGLAAQPSSGTGRVKLIGSSGVSVEFIGGMQNNQPFVAPNGGYILLQCLQAQIGAATTQGSALQYAAADPASGSELDIKLLLSNSSVQ